jgi:hypothetical protein
MAKTTNAAGTTGHRIEEFAEDLGKMLGHARSKAEGWLDQREAIVKNLTQLRDEASKLLSRLGHEGPAAIIRRRGRPAGGGAAKKIIIVGGKTRRTMSAKARAAISAAQKARWAKQKAAAGKK